MKYVILLPLFFFVFVVISSPIHAQSQATFDPICSDGQSQEECAMKKLNHGLMQPAQAKETADEEVGGLLKAVNNFATGIWAFFTGADNLEEGYLPDPNELKETAQGESSTAVLGTTADPEKDLNGMLAGPDGYYGASTPTNEQLPPGIEKPTGGQLYIGPIPVPFTGPVREAEEFWQDSYFPDQFCDTSGNCQKICPVTGQCNK